MKNLGVCLIHVQTGSRATMKAANFSLIFSNFTLYIRLCPVFCPDKLMYTQIQTIVLMQTSPGRQTLLVRELIWVCTYTCDTGKVRACIFNERNSSLGNFLVENSMLARIVHTWSSRFRRYYTRGKQTKSGLERDENMRTMHINIKC